MGGGEYAFANDSILIKQLVRDEGLWNHRRSNTIGRFGTS